jgi:hypothetical protein
MTETTEYPQNAVPKKSRRPLKIVLAAFGAVVVLTGATWGGIAYANGVTAARAHLAAVAFQHSAELAMPRLQTATTAAAAEANTSSADQVVAAEQAAVAAQAAADLAAQQAAAQAAYAAAHAKPSNVGADGLIHCPAGSTANSGDVQGATSCFPDICFHITLPDPNHPECVTAFKP